jgi:hypothetical protein
MWGPTMELLSCHPPGIHNFEVTPTFLENVNLPALGLFRMLNKNNKFLEARLIEFQKISARYKNRTNRGLRQTGISCESVRLNMGMAYELVSNVAYENPFLGSDRSKTRRQTLPLQHTFLAM